MNVSQKKMNFQKNITLLDEKKNLEKNNQTKKFEIDVKNYEFQKEKEFQETKKSLKPNDTSQNLNKKISKENIKSNDLLFNNIQKAIDEEYELTCKEYEQDCMKNKLKEINKFTDTIIADKKDQINYIKEEMSSMEKDYYKSISSIRNVFNKKKNENENNLKLKFEQTLTGYEQTKQRILCHNKEFMNYIGDNIKKIKFNKNYNLKKKENSIEEFILNLKENYSIDLQKNKDLFKISQDDYIYKTQFIQYLLDIINFLNKLFSSSNPSDNDDNNDNNDNNIENINILTGKRISKYDTENIAENLLVFCNNKILEHKNIYNSIKNTNIYSFLNPHSYKNDNDTINNLMSFTKRTNNLKNNNSTERYMNNSNYYNNLNNNNLASGRAGNLLNSKSDMDVINSQASVNQKNQSPPLEIQYFVVDQNSNYIVPLIPESIAGSINEDILAIYSDIVLFLKNEYTKILQITRDNKNTKVNNNILILDKIKSFSEEAFSYLLLNFKKSEQILNIKKKLKLIQNHINEYNQNLNLDKFLSKNNNINNTVIFSNDKSENDIVNNYSILKASCVQNNYVNKKLASTVEEKKYFDEKKNNIGEIKKEIENEKKNTIINGRFNSFFTQYNPNSLDAKITSPFSYQFFNYKKNKYEVDKSLSRLKHP